TALPCGLAQRGEPRRIVRPRYELGCNPRALRKAIRNEARVLGIGYAIRHEQREAAGETIVEVAPLETITALRCARASARDQRAHAPITRTVRCEKHEPRSV